MDVIGSNLRTRDRDFLDNQARMEALVRDLKERLAQVRTGGRAGCGGVAPKPRQAAGPGQD